MNILKVLKSLFLPEDNITGIVENSVSDILFYVADLIRDKSLVAKEIASLGRIGDLNSADQRSVAPQIYKRFEKALSPSQYKTEDFRKMIRDRFGGKVIRNSYIMDLMLPDEVKSCQLKLKASELSRELLPKVGRSALWEFMEKITNNTLISGLVLYSTGDIDFSVPENRMSKLSPDSLREHDQFIGHLADALEELNKKVSGRSDAGKRYGSASNTVEIFSSLGFSKILEQGFLSDIAAKMTGKDGENIPVSLSGNVLKSKDGCIQGMVLVAKDLRKLKNYAQKRLEKITPILKKVSLGDFSEKVEIPKEEDEFTEHMVALNSMIDDFKEMMEEVNKKQEELQKAKSGLEDKVKKRTAELEKSKVGLEAEVKKRTLELQRAKDKLEEEVQGRTKELQEKLLELERFNKVAVGRELKMVELKERIVELEKERDQYLEQHKH